MATDVFISYSRRDDVFVRQLFEALENNGYDAWVDWDNIPKGVDFLQEIYAGIESSPTFLFVVSEDSLLSEVCHAEFAHALKLNKRVIPVIRREVKIEEVAGIWFDKPWEITARRNWTALRHLNWHFAREQDDFERSFAELLNILALDVEYLKTHTRIMVRASEWERQARNPAFLLRSDDLEDAELWLQNAVDKEPPPAELQREYISASRHAEQERIAEEARRLTQIRTFRRASVGLALFTLLAFFAAIFAAVTASNADADANDAERALNSANAQATDIAQTLQPVPPTLTAVAGQVLTQEARVTTLQESEQVQVSLSLAVNARNLLNLYRPNASIALALEAAAIGSGDAPLPEVQRALGLVGYSPGVRYRMQGVESALQATAFSPDGTRAIAGHADGTLVLWDVITGEEIRRWQAHSSAINAVAYSPDGRYLASGGDDRLVIIWDAENSTEIHRLEDHTDRVNAVAFSPDSRTLASGSGTSSNASTATPLDAVIRIWSVTSGQVLFRLNGHTGAVLDVEFSPDGRYLASSAGSLDRTVRVWDLVERRQSLRMPGQGQHNGWVRAIAFHPTKGFLLSSSWDENNGGIIRVWVFDRSACSEFLACQPGVEWQTIYAHTDVIVSLDFAQTPDGVRLMSASRDRTLRVWDFDRSLQVQRFDDHADRIVTMDVSPDGRYVLTGTGSPTNPSDTSLRLWDTEYGHEISQFRGNAYSVWSAAYLPDGEGLILGGGALTRDDGDNTIRIMDVYGNAVMPDITGHNDVIYQVAVNGEAGEFASASWDGTVRLWSYETGELIRTYTGHNEWVNAVDISPDGRYIVSGGCHAGSLQDDFVCTGGGEVRLWNTNTGEAVWELEPIDDGEVLSVTFDHRGETLFVATIGGTVLHYDIASREMITRFAGHRGAVLSVAVSADGRYIATGGADTSVRLWSIETGEMVHIFTGHNFIVRTVAFTPDGRFVLSGSADETVRLWDLGIRENIYVYPAAGEVNSVTVAPDGETVAVVSAQGQVYVWTLPESFAEIEEWIRVNRYVPPLSCDEKASYRIQDENCP